MKKIIAFAFLFIGGFAFAQPAPAPSVPLRLLGQPGGVAQLATSGRLAAAQTPVPYVNVRTPLITDDINAGYKVGDIWNIPTTGQEFSNTQNTAGAAVWSPVYLGSTYPVDAVGGTIPAACYGTKKLLSTYTGNAINVVNPSTGASKDIGFLPSGDIDRNALWSVLGGANASFTASQSGTTLTVSTVNSGTIYPGEQLIGPNYSSNLYTFAAYGTNSTTGTGGAGSYAIIGGSQTVSSQPMTAQGPSYLLVDVEYDQCGGSNSFTGAISGTALTTSAGTPIVGEYVQGTGVPVGETIVSGSGTSWVVSVSATVSSETLTGSNAAYQTVQANMPTVNPQSMLGNAVSLVFNSQLQGTTIGKWLTIPNSVTLSTGNGFSAVSVWSARDVQQNDGLLYMPGSAGSFQFGFTGSSQYFYGLLTAYNTQADIMPTVTPEVAGYLLGSSGSITTDTLTASITAGVLNVTVASNNTIQPSGETINVPGYGTFTTSSQLSGTTGGIGSYQLAQNIASVPSTAMTGLGLPRSGTTLWLDNSQSYSNYAYTSTLTGGGMGCLNAISGGNCGYNEQAALLIYARQLSVGTDMPTITAALDKYYGLTPQVRDTIDGNGDSITEGYGTSLNLTYPRQMMGLLKKPYRIIDSGAFGQTSAQQYSYLSTTGGSGAVNIKIADAFPYHNADNELFEWSGTNDIGNATTAAGIYANQQAIVTLGHSNYCKVNLIDILPRSSFPTGGTPPGTQESTRLSFNALVVANSAGADGIIDLASDPTLGNYTGNGNTILYFDGTHLTSFGQSFTAQDASNLLNSRN